MKDWGVLSAKRCNWIGSLSAKQSKQMRAPYKSELSRSPSIGAMLSTLLRAVRPTLSRVAAAAAAAKCGTMPRHMCIK